MQATPQVHSSVHCLVVTMNSNESLDRPDDENTSSPPPFLACSLTDNQASFQRRPTTENPTVILWEILRR
jgi:hypothetical protein